MGAGYLYLRFVKGWRLVDFFYVSQASLKASTSALKQGAQAGGSSGITSQEL